MGENSAYSDQTFSNQGLHCLLWWLVCAMRKDGKKRKDKNMRLRHAKKDIKMI